jgi:hypothetical protein
MSAPAKITAGRENGRSRPRGYADWRLKGANSRVAISGGGSVVLVDEAAEAVAALDLADGRCRRWFSRLR